MKTDLIIHKQLDYFVQILKYLRKISINEDDLLSEG